MQKTKMAESLVTVTHTHTHTHTHTQVYLDNNKKINNINIARLNL